MTDIIVVGGGTAGLTAAIYALRSNKTVLLFENAVFGGQITQASKIENFPSQKSISGYEFSQAMLEQANSAGLVTRNEDVIKVSKNCVTTTEGSYECRSVIIATGVSRRKAGVPGEERLLGAGVSYCAVCDGAFFRNRSVAVIGGGNTAFEDALFLSDVCAEVYIIHRRAEFRAEPYYVGLAEKKQNIKLVKESVVSEIKGNLEVTGIDVKNVGTGEVSSLAVDGVFIAIGWQSANERFADSFELDRDGFIVCDKNMCTSTPGIFAAGDCIQKEIRQLTTAAADGTVAAISAIRYIDAR